jgi:poly-beta-1,6-N-acetyl-D-glucosamine synthase
MILISIVILLFIIYTGLVLYFWRSWKSIPVYTPAGTATKTMVSVIIPARNEAGNIGALLDALKNQTHPGERTEIIVVDDHSEDETAVIVLRYPSVRLVRLTKDKINSYKKKAIETGIAASRGELIVTTDADCLPPPGWLQLLVSFYEEKKAEFISAPVAIDCNGSILQSFQGVDFMILQGITASAVSANKLSMCNGANLAYTRRAFYEVGGFEGIDDIASGDDMLLMYKISQKYPAAIAYLKSIETIVSTQPMKSWKDFFNQRIRWASKARHYQDKRLFPILFLVYLFNLSFLVLLGAGIYGLFRGDGSGDKYWIALVALWVAKTMVEWPLMSSTAAFFNKGWARRLFFVFQPLHIGYTILAGLLGQVGKYEWKGRRVR